MEVALESNGFFIGIEYLATFCCGMVGGLAAVRKGYDIFAILVTTWLTALGVASFVMCCSERFLPQASPTKGW